MLTKQTIIYQFRWQLSNSYVDIVKVWGLVELADQNQRGRILAQSSAVQTVKAVTPPKTPKVQKRVFSEKWKPMIFCEFKKHVQNLLGSVSEGTDFGQKKKLNQKFIGLWFKP